MKERERLRFDALRVMGPEKTRCNPYAFVLFEMVFWMQYLLKNSDVMRRRRSHSVIDKGKSIARFLVCLEMNDHTKM
jgi:hypothetical protein